MDRCFRAGAVQSFCGSLSANLAIDEWQARRITEVIAGDAAT
jgi:hypothetical protein